MCVSGTSPKIAYALYFHVESFLLGVEPIGRILRQRSTVYSGAAPSRIESMHMHGHGHSHSHPPGSAAGHSHPSPEMTSGVLAGAVAATLLLAVAELLGG